MKKITHFPTENRRVLHMLSGGRDSFLAAALLVEQGYKVEMITFDNGHIDGINRASTVAANLKEHYPEGKITYIKPVKTGMTFHSYMMKDWYRKSKEREELFPELQSYQAHCLSCRTAMYIHAIAYCIANDIPYLSEGARKNQGFFVELPEMKERYERLCSQNGIQLLWPVYDLESDMDRKRFLDDRGLPTKTLEPQCYLGCPLHTPLTAEERRDLSRYYDIDLLPQLQKDIETLIPVKKSLVASVADTTAETVDQEREGLETLWRSRM